MDFTLSIQLDPPRQINAEVLDNELRVLLGSALLGIQVVEDAPEHAIEVSVHTSRELTAVEINQIGN